MTRSGRWLVRAVLAALCWSATPAALISTLPTQSARADEEDPAVRVFRQVRPSVVTLKNEEGGATGILLDANGLVLTNAHVMASPLPYTVYVGEPQPDGSERAVAYTNVTTVGFHPTLDMALVRIDPHEHPDTKLTPATLSNARPSTGQSVFVIGNPAAGGVLLEKSLTAGMISCADREVDGLHYYQFDAAVNPGNSGGPVCDRSGRVLGMVTFKYNNVQSIAFAIPLDALDTRAFVPQPKRKVDPVLAAEFKATAETFAARADRINDTEGHNGPHAELWRKCVTDAGVCFRAALLANPADADLLDEVAASHRILGQFAAARAYGLRSFSYATWHRFGYPYHNLGRCLQAEKNNADALIAYREGLAKFPELGALWEDLALLHQSRHEYADAAHAASMALVAGTPPGRHAEEMRRLIDTVKARVPDAARPALDARLVPKALATELKQAMAAAEQARAARKLYVTAAGEDLMRRLNVPETPTALASVPTEPRRPRHDIDAIAAGQAAPRSGIVITPTRRQSLPVVTDAGH